MLTNLMTSVGFITSALVIVYLCYVTFGMVGDFYVELCSAKARSLNCSDSQMNLLQDRVSHLEEQLIFKK